MPVYHSPGYYGLAVAVLVVCCAFGLLVLIGVGVGAIEAIVDLAKDRGSPA
jgi:hypothetical protein